MTFGHVGRVDSLRAVRDVGGPQAVDYTLVVGWKGVVAWLPAHEIVGGKLPDSQAPVWVCPAEEEGHAHSRLVRGPYGGAYHCAEPAGSLAGLWAVMLN